MSKNNLCLINPTGSGIAIFLRNLAKGGTALPTKKLPFISKRKLIISGCEDTDRGIESQFYLQGHRARIRGKN